MMSIISNRNKAIVLRVFPKIISCLKRYDGSTLSMRVLETFKNRTVLELLRQSSMQVSEFSLSVIFNYSI